MLFLIFQVGKDRFALEAGQVAEVVPLVNLTSLPKAVMGVAGLFNYRGAPVPVIDLCRMFFGQASPLRMSTRIMLVHYRSTPGGTHLLGLMAERVTETLRLDPTAFVPSGVEVKDAPYLGPVVRDSRGLIQRVEINRLLPAALQEVLFQPVIEPAPI
jgi:chemotaxis-related protein WspB